MKVTQSCLIFCDHMDDSPPGSSVHGILQTRVLEWVAGASWPGIEAGSPALQTDSLLSEPPRSPIHTIHHVNYIIWCWIQKYEEKYSRLGIERHESCYFNEGGRKGLSTLHWTHSWQKWGSRGEACGCMEEGLPVRGNKGRNPSCSKRRSRWPWASEGEQQEMRSDR